VHKYELQSCRDPEEAVEYVEVRDAAFDTGRRIINSSVMSRRTRAERETNSVILVGQNRTLENPGVTAP
jgi:hypothetical protein